LALSQWIFDGTLEATVEGGFIIDVGESPSMNFSSGRPGRPDTSGITT
jgi:hypothetical protein